MKSKFTSAQVAKIASLIENSKTYEEFIRRGKFKQWLLINHLPDAWDAIQSVAASALAQARGKK